MEGRRVSWATRIPELALVVSMGAFAVLGVVYADRLPVWHEVVSALPSSGYRVLDGADARRAEPALPLERSCTEPTPPRFVFSSSRPHLGACAGGQTIPVMVTAYASGLAAAPFALARSLHGDDTFTLRRIWIFVAALSLLLTFGLVRRIADRETAALACLLTAVSTPFVLINALLLPFETLPSTFLVAALATWVGGSEGDRAAPSVLRASAAALLVGLALATNLKAVLIIGPVLVLAWSSGAGWARGTGWRHWAASALALALPLAPTIIFAASDPGDGFRSQVGFRLGMIAQNLRWDRLITEPVLLANFAADVTSYLDLVTRRDALRVTWMHALVAVPLAHCVVAGVAHMVRRPLGSKLSAACGVVIATYFFTSMLVYRQYPGGNYSPLHDVLGIAIAAGLVDLSRAVHGALARRGKALFSRHALALVGSAAFVVGSVWNLLSRVDALVHSPFSTNAVVQRELASYLRDTPDRDALVLTTTYNGAGVLDALGHGAIRAVQAQRLFADCGGEPERVEACLDEELRWLLTRSDVLPLRVVVPVSLTMVDHPREVLIALPGAIERSARALGLDARVERRFPVPGGQPAVALYRVDAPPGWTAPAPATTTTAPRPEAPEPVATAESRCRVDDRAVRALFAGLTSIRPDDGCALEGVRAERTEIRVTWSRGDAVADPAVLFPSGCGGEAVERGLGFDLSVPPSLRDACPATVAAVRELIVRERFDATVE